MSDSSIGLYGVYTNLTLSNITNPNKLATLRGVSGRVSSSILCPYEFKTIAISGNSATGRLWKIPVGYDGVHISPMLPITYRESWLPPIPKFSSVKGSTLTNLEIDANFKILQDAIIQWMEDMDWARAILANRWIRIVDHNPITNEPYLVRREDSYNTMIRVFSSVPCSVMLPRDDAEHNYLPIGSAVLVSWNGGTEGWVSVVGDPGVTVVTPDTNMIARRYGKVTAIKTGANYWELEGNLAIESFI